jgi:hypothetical protein
MLAPSGVLTLEVPDVLRVIGRTRLVGLRHTDVVLPSIGHLQQLVALDDARRQRCTVALW